MWWKTGMLLVTLLSQDWDWHMNKETRSKSFSDFPDMSTWQGKPNHGAKHAPWFKEVIQSTQRFTQKESISGPQSSCVYSQCGLFIYLSAGPQRNQLCCFITPSFITFQWTSTLDHGWWNTAAHNSKTGLQALISHLWTSPDPLNLVTGLKQH